jgi:hypothetical protein
MERRRPMPLDARIRMGLEREASEIDPAPDPALRTILERGPRRRAARTAGRAVALVAVVSTFVVGGFAAIRATDDGDHRAADSQISSVSPIDGEWRVTLSIEDGLRAGLGYGQARRLAGRRDLELTLGVVRQIRPGSFDTIPVHGTFEVDGPFVILRDQGETLLFRWSLSGNQLRLTLVDDSRKPSSKRADRLIWTTQPWVRVG